MKHDQWQILVGIKRQARFHLINGAVGGTHIKGRTACCSGHAWRRTRLRVTLVTDAGGGQQHQSRPRVPTSSRVASVGGQQILDCSIIFPGDQPINYILQWRKEGIKDPILFKYDGYSPQVTLPAALPPRLAT
ncbi:hypothetical protein C0Q70_12732 [Pomacea canaliculata]|uniref:Ig-like domain-containing protein n=1 Tax=Pomacea canaliculata TaxID=400727 RepID=A0A2T7P2D3_POMCA|nr:hypothetical protein C0Q70_12732 [Pomacea canaliculata]